MRRRGDEIIAGVIERSNTRSLPWNLATPAPLIAVGLDRLPADASLFHDDRRWF